MPRKRTKRPPDPTATIRAEIRRGNGALVNALGDVARELEALRLPELRTRLL